MDFKELIEKTAPKSDWFSMKEPGSYQIRIITNFLAFQRAPYKEGQDPTVNYLCRVIDREDGEIRLWSFPWSIMRQIATLQSDEDTASDAADQDCLCRKDHALQGCGHAD